MLYRGNIGRSALRMTESSLLELVKRETIALCIHGMYGGAWYFARWLKRFKRAGLGALALDLRGHHGAPLLPRETLGTVSMQDYADDVLAVIALLTHAGVSRKRIMLVGHSMGGLVAQMVTAHHALGSLVLVASAVPKPQLQYGHLPAPLLTLRFHEEMSRTGLSRERVLLPTNQNLIRRLFAGIPEPLLSETVVRLVPESARARDEMVRGVELNRSTRHPPTLIIAGKRDPIVPQALLYALHLSTPGSSFFPCPSGHFPMLEPIAERVADAITLWTS